MTNFDGSFLQDKSTSLGNEVMADDTDDSTDCHHFIDWDSVEEGEESQVQCNSQWWIAIQVQMYLHHGKAYHIAKELLATVQKY